MMYVSVETKKRVPAGREQGRPICVSLQTVSRPQVWCRYPPSEAVETAVAALEESRLGLAELQAATGIDASLAVALRLSGMYLYTRTADTRHSMFATVQALLRERGVTLKCFIHSPQRAKQSMPLLCQVLPGRGSSSGSRWLDCERPVAETKKRLCFCTQPSIKIVNFSQVVEGVMYQPKLC